MAFYKDPQGTVHALDDAAFEYLLPAGSIPITDSEATLLAAASVNAWGAVQARAERAKEVRYHDPALRRKWGSDPSELD